MEVTFAIATHHNPEGLYLSVFAALQQLEKSNLDWEILIAADGGDPNKWNQAHPDIRCIRLTGNDMSGSPQGTRDVGIRAAKYKNVLFVDSHVIVSDIEKWVVEHERLHAAISFPAMIGVSSEMFKLYGSEFAWDTSFWYKKCYSQPKMNTPYPVLQASHSGLMFDRDFYIEIGGYTNLLVGYGAEESLYGLKTWMMGRENFLIPSITHAHYQPANRNPDAQYEDRYKRNFITAAYVLGGEKYLRLTEQFYKLSLTITPDIQRERQRMCGGPFKGNLDLLREYCRQRGIT